MSSDKESFDDRIRKIAAARGAAAEPVSAQSAAYETAARQRGPSKLWLLGPALAGVLLLAIGAVVVIGLIDQKARRLELAVATEMPGKPDALVPPWMIDQLRGLLNISSDDLQRGPIDFLPAAPDGWVRVTADDAALPNALGAIKARWPQGGGAVPVEQNLGYKHLSRYLDLQAKPDIEQKVLSQAGTSALYLNGNGEYLNVRLDFTAERSALGAKDDSESWIAALAEIEDKTLEGDEILERAELGGIGVTNQTQASGQSLIARPIGSDIYATNAVKIAVPLTNRAVLRLQGVAAPFFAQTLITSIDRDRLLARHN